ncbi:MAG TPA: ribosome rescue protein RqcH [Methanomassiliicoccales archaeon]|nr:ribosome rescue protein RqcH [Methanomassiliicoccales archaeon]
MKSEMSAFDVLRVVKEMQELVGGYLDKVFHWDRRNVLLRANVPGQGRREVLLIDQNFLYVSKERPDIPDTPSQFAVHLRKLLSNARITGIRQHEFDRVVILEMQRDEAYQVVIELFGEGNLLLVSNGRIVNCLVSKTWKHRDVRPGATYEFPPARFNPQMQKQEDFEKAIRSSRSDIVRTLATSINLGGQYAEEVCLRAGVDKSMKASTVDIDALGRLTEAALSILAEASTGTSSCAYMEANGDVTDVSPVELRQYEGKPRACFPSFSEGLQYYLEHRRAKEKEAAVNPEVQRLLRQLAQLKEAEASSNAEADNLVKQAEAVYANYPEAASALSMVKMAAEEKGWDELKAMGKEGGNLRSIDPKRKVISLALGELVVELEYTKGLEENASLIYAKARDAKDKATRSHELIEDTESKIVEIKRKDALEAQKSKVETKPTKKFWFEAYKWFITSGGHLVLAGRDARTNDQVVKKHLTSADRYAHADVHGAPSVVIKDGASASEQELAEACAFALAHSKAWNAGVREGSAYWVLPDQVSKTPDAGEFVPRGAFIIRGKRNYVHHIQLQLAIGEIENEGARKIMCGPKDAVLQRSKKYAVLAPGDEDRSVVSARLAKELNVPEEEVSRILPPGNAEIKERVGL